MVCFFRGWLLVTCALALAGCPAESDDEDSAAGDDDDSELDCSSDSDGDGIDDCTEVDLGTDPDLSDTDGDGFEDGQELDCVSDPLDGTEVCYACGWAHNDPGILESTGAAAGDVVANMALVDQCLEDVDLWDFAGSYIMLYMTATW